jgi:hypothetical protein
MRDLFNFVGFGRFGQYDFTNLYNLKNTNCRTNPFSEVTYSRKPNQALGQNVIFNAMRISNSGI